MIKLLLKVSNFIKMLKRENEMAIINYYTMQIVDFGWITIDDVPLRYREKVRQMVELATAGSKETGEEV
ncbi:hypothetical protein, partial [Klebsiella pneumoniae]|uniref:hypothetical protein n=1 Tax=Klebsiella pneumoniae TaxID=573 RepID=UPI003A84F9D0